MPNENPFALIRASDYTDQQINSLWVEIGDATVNRIIDPQSPLSKYILGGKGTGKTHLLRYHSYQVARKRNENESGLHVLKRYGYLAVFLRATGLDAARFETVDPHAWQHLFGIYLELKLAEVLLDALIDIRRSSIKFEFNDRALIAHLSHFIHDDRLASCDTLEDLLAWVTEYRRTIDDAVNNFALTESLDVRILFAIGRLALPIRDAMDRWSPEMTGIRLIYMIDEIENFNASQQEVVNSLIRYSEGMATFRVTGRLYGRKTFATLSTGEENREDAEFRTTKLDEILQQYQKFPDFARKFVAKRISSVSESALNVNGAKGRFEPREYFEEVDSNDLYETTISALRIDSQERSFVVRFHTALEFLVDAGKIKSADGLDIEAKLTNGFPAIVARLNVLLFCKRLKSKISPIKLAEEIFNEATRFVANRKAAAAFYRNAYGHWAADLFAQLCRDARVPHGVPYAGFDSLVKMSSGNPRSLLVLLGHIYEIVHFRGEDFSGKRKVPISIQTEGVGDAARFMHERDTNYGSESDLARRAVERLAVLLRTARYALSIPEVSPLAVSFSHADLSPISLKILHAALNYSYLFEVNDGRPDRNSQDVNRKVQMNPLLSPNWGLPIGRRGDLSLDAALVNAIFDPNQQLEFEAILRRLDGKWNSPFQTFSKVPVEQKQTRLF